MRLFTLADEYEERQGGMREGQRDGCRESASGFSAPLSRESNRHGTHIGEKLPRLWYIVEVDLYITSYVFRLVLVGMGASRASPARRRTRPDGGPVACIDGICYGRGRHK